MRRMGDRLELPAAAISLTIAVSAALADLRAQLSWVMSEPGDVHHSHEGKPASPCSCQTSYQTTEVRKDSKPFCWKLRKGLNGFVDVLRIRITTPLSQ